MELYVSVDTLILTDVFEAFRDMCLSCYKLDPCQYFTLPGMMTGVTLDLMTDPNMYNFASDGVRGGLASINHRHAKPTTKACPILTRPNLSLICSILTSIICTVQR